tara:strand:- start:28 stop:753 length:726 start_codon:yes stop_codon:yes gene_type:complete
MHNRNYNNYKQDIVENVYQTSVTPIAKNDYSSKRAVYSDDQFVYKVIKQSRDDNQFELFLKNYQGDLKLLDVYRENDLVIFKIRKLFGKTISQLAKENDHISLNIDTLTQWFKTQVKEIHNTGVRCYKKYDSYKIKNDPWGKGFVYTFVDWNNSNYIYNKNINKLYLVDLEPANWISRNIWDCVVRDHFNKFIKSFDHIDYDDKQYISKLEDSVQQELDKEIPLFLACPGGFEPPAFSSAN